VVSASEAQPTLILSLLRPEAYPHPVGAIELIETHISWVLLTGRFAYKIKKPINLGFVQAASLSQRQHYCQEELRLNRRLAPKLYLGVVPVVGPEEEARILSDDIATESGQSGTVIETAVKMHQFQPQKLLGKLLTKGAIETKQLTALAWD
jgi:aminoglycoside phosphotransferase family enzyme